MGTVNAAKIEFETIRRSKVYEQVARQLQQRIIDELKPGDLLPPERELVQMLGVSRSSVPDAIRSWEVVGLLEPRQGIGTRGREPSAECSAKPLPGVLLR